MVPLQVVERKGFGHPDTIADAVANEISRQYSRFALAQFGGIPRHSFDKVVLSGGTAALGFGHSTQHSPITCFVIGKATRRVGSTPIPIEEIASDATRRVLREVMSGPFAEQVSDARVVLDLNDGIGAEHPGHYYSPDHSGHLDVMDGFYPANDSAFVFGHGDLTGLERLAFAIESTLLSLTDLPIGSDIKTLLTSEDGELNVQIAVPFIASLTEESLYFDGLRTVRSTIEAVVHESADYEKIHISLNSKDVPGHGYLTLAGSSLDKGDQGAVGRGNGFRGVISMLRPQSMESHAGKNPARSAGRIYPFLCRRLASRAESHIGEAMDVGLQSVNGVPLTQPNRAILVRNRSAQAAALLELTHGDVTWARHQILDDSQLHEDLFGRI